MRLDKVLAAFCLNFQKPCRDARETRLPKGCDTWTQGLVGEALGFINLAGPDFRAVICGYEEPRRERRCERTVAPPHTV